MGKYLLVVFCFCFQFSFSQNWSVINLTDKYNYRLDSDPVITATIWADSAAWNGSDSVFYLNRIMCDSCATLVGGPDPFCDTCYGLKNQPQFLQRECVVSPSGVINFRDTGNFVILGNQPVNTIWTFDTAQSVFALVASLITDTVFGVVDSVKVIQLSSLDTILLSKNYGILRFPIRYGLNSSYRLVGIEGRGLGEQVPKYADFFNFDVGDMFEYHGGYSYTGNMYCGFSDEACLYVRKETITTKTQTGDTTWYGFSSMSRQICWHASNPSPPPPCTTFGALTGLKMYIDTAANWLNQSYQNEAWKLEYINGNAFLPCLNNDSAYDFIKTAVDSNGVYIKYYGVSNPECLMNASTCNYVFHSDIQHGSDTLFGSNYWSYAEAAGTGIGIIHFTYSRCFEGGYFESLVAYRKGNDTVGVITPDYVLSSTNEIDEFASQVQVFPNPARDKIQIVFPEPVFSDIILFDLQGKNIMAASTTRADLELDVGKIENGLYFLTFQMQERSFTRKIIIMH